MQNNLDPYQTHRNFDVLVKIQVIDISGDIFTENLKQADNYKNN